uniref:Caspase family p20 domain-containing protein n=1 Tax=Amphimedon queenslandica TaxID=400682 RepID=A0A1X7T6G9_AMPQE
MFNPIEIPYVSKSDMPKHSHYLILGTRVDVLGDESATEKKLREMNESLIECKANKKVIPRNKREIIFPVNTLLPAGSKEREGASESLCDAVSNCKVAMVAKLPVRLFTFEIALQREAKKKKRSFLTRHEVIQIGKSLRLDKESESDIDEAVRYLHDVTIILYYHEVLPNIIFVDPKPILDTFSHLIAITYVDHDKLNLIANPSPSPEERHSLINFGLFKESLLAIIGEKIFNEDFQPSHMITLLLHLHIIAKVEKREDYFFPCALPSHGLLNDPPTEIRPLLIAWEIDETTLAIPQGLFPLTIVHLLEQKDVVDFCPEGNEYYRYHDAMSLRVYKKYTIDIINHYTHIEIRFDGCKEFCPQIRELVTEAIKKSNDDLKVASSSVPEESQVNGGETNGTTPKHHVDNTDEDGSGQDLRLPKVCVGKKDEDDYDDEVVYLMNTTPWGYCLIINMKKGREDGNEKDTDKLRTLFKHDLQFAFRVYNNLKAEDIDNLMKNVKEASHQWSCCFIMFILAHGGTENMSAYFLTSDNKRYKVSSIKKKIESIDDLNGKPKLLFIQSCRGDLLDTGLEVLDGNHGEKNKTPSKIPRGSDFLTSFATIEDYAACRGADGSRFIQCLCDVFTEYRDKWDVVTMMTMVTKEVAAIARDVEGEGGIAKGVRQNPETTFTFRKFLFFGKPPQWVFTPLNKK